MRKITIELTPSSINAAISKLKREKEWRKKKADDLTEKLAQVGADASGYDNIVHVRRNDSKDGWSVVAKSRGIAFIEFGAGDAAVGYPKDVGIDISPGSWSASDLGTGEYVENRARTGQGYWIFNGTEYTEIPQRQGMIRAEEAILQGVKEAAEEVFSGE